jgi:Arc/MetJ family transcription regulator
MSTLRLTGGVPMRTTVNLDDELLAAAQKATGVSERTALIHAGLKALIERESARRLARLGGSEPQLESIRRRRSARA